MFHAIVFEINKELFAADVMQVERIMDKGELESVYKAPAYVKGLIHLPECTVPVIDASEFFMNISADSDKSYIVIAKVQDKERIGLLVDKVHEVITCYEDEVSEIRINGEISEIGKLIRKSDKTLRLIDIEKIFSNEEELKEFFHLN